MNIKIISVLLLVLTSFNKPHEETALKAQGCDCYITTSILTILYANANPIPGRKICQLPPNKRYKVLEIKKKWWVNDYIFFFKVKDEKLRVEGWVNDGLLLQFVEPCCYSKK